MFLAKSGIGSWGPLADQRIELFFPANDATRDLFLSFAE